ncbi:MAG: DUF2284 domain-containing protein [Eubacteriales bacterium]|jgi:predicted metal-binding protein|nr:DUF2284 domain-containing protein [Eubacteriales bacterium]
MKIETYENTVSVAEYVENYVNVEEFLEYCKECREYNKVWSCPPYNFNPIDFWKSYNNFYILGKKIYIDEDYEKNFDELLKKVKMEITEELEEKSKIYPHSMPLSAGNCAICGEDNCTRKTGQPCRFPEKMRYSIESLGGNVGLTIRNLLGLKLLWIEDGKVPEYFILVGGLLY